MIFKLRIIINPLTMVWIRAGSEAVTCIFNGRNVFRGRHGLDCSDSGQGQVGSL